MLSIFLLHCKNNFALMEKVYLMPCIVYFVCPSYPWLALNQTIICAADGNLVYSFHLKTNSAGLMPDAQWGVVRYANKKSQLLDSHLSFQFCDSHNLWYSLVMILHSTVRWRPVWYLINVFYTKIFTKHFEFSRVKSRSTVCTNFRIPPPPPSAVTLTLVGGLVCPAETGGYISWSYCSWQV